MVKKPDSPLTTRARFISIAGSAAFLAACSRAGTGSSKLLPTVAATPGKTGIKPMDLSGYWTSHDVGISYLWDSDNNLVMSATTDQSTFLTTVYDARTDTTYSMSTDGSTPQVGDSYSPCDGATCTFDDNYSVSMSAAGGDGSAVITPTTTSTYTSYTANLYHSIACTDTQSEEILRVYGSGGGGGGGCHVHCLESLSVACVVSAAFAIGTTAAFLLTIFAAMSNPLTWALAVGLILEHGLAVAEITWAISECMSS